MRIFVINLERSPERRRLMQTQFDLIGLEAEFFSASDGANLDLGTLNLYDERKALWIMGHPMSKAEIGCFSSHYRLWQLCRTLNKPIVIMEDDIRIDANFSRALEIAERIIGKHRFLRLAALFKRRYQTLAVPSDGYELIRYLKGPYGMQCYALSPEGAALLIQRARVWIKQVDAYIDSFWDHGLASLALVPFHVTLDKAHSEDSTIGARWESNRAWHRALRRNLTHFFLRVRRGWYNLRFTYTERTGG